MAKLTIAENASAATTPAAGNVILYPKTDGLWYYKASDGVEHPFLAEGSQNNFTQTQTWNKAADIASAATLALPADGNLADVTGVTPTTDFTVPAGTPTTAFGPWRLRAAGAWSITNTPGQVEIVGGASLTLAAGDVVEVWQASATLFRVMQMNSSGGGADISLSNLDVTGQDKVCTAWVNFNGTGTVAIRDSFNVSGITDNGVGEYTITFATAMANANYTLASAAGRNATEAGIVSQPQFSTPPLTTACRVHTGYADGTSYDFTFVGVIFFGGK